MKGGAFLIPFIGVEMRDKPGAIQRLFVMLGQRNVEIEQMTVKKDHQAGSLTAVIGIDGTPERAAWVMRQMTRHQDVIRTYDVQNTAHAVLVAAGPADGMVQAVPGVSCSPIDTHAGYYTVAGPRQGIDEWIARNHAKIFGLYPSCLTSQTQERGGVASTYQIRGGWNHERKIILRRQRRSEVASR